jgi:hypothetical protein
MFNKTRRAIQRVNNAIDKVDNVVQKGNRALTTTNGQSLTGKARDAVTDRVAGNSNRCGCNAKIGDNDFSCKKPACVRAAVAQLESIHPEKNKFVQNGKLKKGAKPPANWKPKW